MPNFFWWRYFFWGCWISSIEHHPLLAYAGSARSSFVLVDAPGGLGGTPVGAGIVPGVDQVSVPEALLILTGCPVLSPPA